MVLPGEKSRVEFDHMSTAYAAGHVAQLTQMRSQCPMSWAESHGGFWIATTYEDCVKIATNGELFSSANHVGQGDSSRTGILIPPMPFQLPLNEVDAPLHMKRRLIEAPFFSPKYLRIYERASQRIVDQAIDDVIERGAADMMRDLCMRIPASVALHVCGIGAERWADFAIPKSMAAILPPHHPDFPHEALDRISREVLDVIRKRREHPRDDVATALALAKIDGQPIADDVAAGMLHTLATGGFDTAISVLSNSFEWLERHPDQREQLRTNPDLLPNAIEELLRMFPPLHVLARNATRENEMRGQIIRDGEKVAMSLWAANRDPAQFANPEEMCFDRPNAGEHLSFSAGPHRCLGAPLARQELKVAIGEILRRLPDYRIDRSRAQRFDEIGRNDGWKTMPIAFTPGKRKDR